MKNQDQDNRTKMQKALLTTLFTFLPNQQQQSKNILQHKEHHENIRNIKESHTSFFPDITTKLNTAIHGPVFLQVFFGVQCQQIPNIHSKCVRLASLKIYSLGIQFSTCHHYQHSYRNSDFYFFFPIPLTLTSFLLDFLGPGKQKGLCFGIRLSTNHFLYLFF